MQRCKPIILLTVTYSCAYLFRDTVYHQFQLHPEKYLLISENKTFFEATIVVIFIIYCEQWRCEQWCCEQWRCEQWCCELWCCIDHLATTETLYPHRLPRTRSTSCFTYGTINLIMGPKKLPRKIESKEPDIKLPPNIVISKLGIESKQVVICIIMYFNEMFEKKDREIKNYRQMCPCLRRLLSGTTNWKKLSSWTEEYIDNGRRYTSCITCRGLQVHCTRTNPRTPTTIELAIEDISMASNQKYKERISVTSCLNFATEM